jgi:hypothetical protein
MHNSKLVEGNAAVSAIDKALDKGIEVFSQPSPEVRPMEGDSVEGDSE